jgi:phage terminase large subunit-like protein
MSLLERANAGAGGPDKFTAMLRAMPIDEAEALAFSWGFLGRPSQLPPPGDWRTWLILAGRGFGKTRTGAEGTRAAVEQGTARRIALIAPTAADARDVMVEGESGLLAISPPSSRPLYEPSKRRLTWPTGAVATLYSGDEPERLRGPQHDFFWADELAAYFDPEAVWTQLQMGLRLGQAPRGIVTTTPRPIPLLRRLMADPSVRTTRGSTHDNKRNLPAAFLDAITQQYGGTRIGRQEIDAEMLDDAPGALWHLADIDALRVKAAPELRRVCVGVDPAVSSNKKSNETGIVVAGVGDCACRGKVESHAFVLGDSSGIYTPAGWAQAVRSAYHRHRADRIVAEVNQGGAMVEATLRAYGGDSLPITTVHASRGKVTRAEPIAALCEQGKVHHVGHHSKLEDQMTQWSPTEDATSPDRVDALVWALTSLMLEEAPIEFHGFGQPILPRRGGSTSARPTRQRGFYSK